MAVVIDSAEQATPAWLTQTLYDAGVLTNGEVERVSKTANTAYHSQTTRLQLSYAGLENEQQPPTQLFLKILTEHKGKREVGLYRQLKDRPFQPTMIVPCYAAHYEGSSGISNLLLADVSATHREASSREEVRAFTASPPLWQVEAMIDTLARWHALWWDFRGSEQLPAEVLDIFADESNYRGYAAYCRDAWSRFAEVEKTLAAEYEPLYAPLVEGLPRLWQGYLAHRFGGTMNLTLAHGDCYFSQFLYPVSDRNGRMFLIDFDSVRLDLPTDDLMFLFITFWKREERLMHESSMLERYHTALCTAGVDTYAWDTFINDYRFGIVQHAMYPIFGRLNGDDESFWQLRLRAITAAYADWDCDEWLKASGL